MFCLLYVCFAAKFLGILPLYIGMEIILGIAILNKFSGVYGILSIFTGHPINFFQWFLNLSSIIILPFYINALKYVKKPHLGKFSLVCCVFLFDTLLSILFIIYFALYWFETESSKTVPLPASATSTSVPDINKIEDKFDNVEIDIGNDNKINDNNNIGNKVQAKKRDYTSISATISLNNILATPTTSHVINTAIATAVSKIDENLASQSASQTYEFAITLMTSIIISAIRIYFSLIVLSFTRALLKSSKYGVNSDDYNNYRNRNNNDNDNNANGSDNLHSNQIGENQYDSLLSNTNNDNANNTNSNNNNSNILSGNGIKDTVLNYSSAFITKLEDRSVDFIVWLFDEQ
ncbi:Kei1p [Ascoidea rubescens DSM 1968]|uniref:DUF1753-domain-containing protein n=1 Tax=Ascoidea rubescens DSM 1968 TaxID=1344418 RepID=A0A1D2VL37_9ASCO|nr:DUF1753-domain-containing protein [Ascoidea rubescens DSM 1968]ODV62309.1 DUF1753-domain-containing protein [Ascoidea rubescens DSM 1968]